MKPRDKVDPYLHIIRTTIRTIASYFDDEDDADAPILRITGDLENARYSLYRAFDAKDRDLAIAWLAACRSSVIEVETLAYEEEVKALASVIREALTAIEGAIE